MRQRLGHFPPIFAAQVARSKSMGVHVRQRGKQAHKQRFLGHFQAEDGHRGLLADGNILGDIEREGRLPHRGPRREDDQFRRLQPGSQAIELRVVRRQPRHALSFRNDALQALHIVLNHVFHGHQAHSNAVFGNLENRGLGAIEQGIRLFLRVQSRLLDGVGSVDQAAQQRFLFDDPSMVFQIRNSRHPVG